MNSGKYKSFFLLFLTLIVHCKNPPKTEIIYEPETIQIEEEETLPEVASQLKPEPELKWIANSEKLTYQIQPKFAMTEPFQDKMAFVKFLENKNLKEGYINSDGTLLIPTNFDYPNFSFNYGLARVIKNNKTGFIDKKGKLIIPFSFDDAGDFTETITWFKNKKLYGFIDLSGKKIIEASYSLAETFQEDLALVSLNGKYGFIDRKGKIVIPLKYENGNSFREGVASVKFNRKYFFIDKSGKQAIKKHIQTRGCVSNR